MVTRPRDNIRRRLRPFVIALRRTRKRVGWAIEAHRATAHPSPVIVVGPQKSGTSAVAAVLGAVSGLSVTIDLQREIHHPTTPSVWSGATTIDRLVRRNAADFSRGIVKEPNLTLLVPHLHQRFPLSPFVFVIRDPRETVRSTLQRLDLPGDPAFAADWRRRLPPGWDIILDPAWMGIVSDNYVENLGRRWVALAEVALGAPEAFTIVRYEDFVADKEGIARQLAAEVGIDAHHRLDGMQDKVWQRAGDPVSWTEFFGDESFAALEAIVGPTMAAFGYSPSESGVGPGVDPIGPLPLAPEVSERLVGSPAFKAGGRGDPSPAGSIPVHLRD